MPSHIFECNGTSRHIWCICRAVDGGIALIRPHGAAPNVISVGNMHTDAKIELAGLPPASQLMSSYEPISLTHFRSICRRPRLTTQNVSPGTSSTISPNGSLCR